MKKNILVRAETVKKHLFEHEEKENKNLFIYAYFTGFYDDDKQPIFVGDKLKSKWGYEVIVVKNKDGNYSGKLVCDEKHSCKDIPYALNKGKGYSKINLKKNEKRV